MCMDTKTRTYHSYRYDSNKQHNYDTRYACSLVHLQWKNLPLDWSTRSKVWEPKKSRCAWIMFSGRRCARKLSKYSRLDASAGTDTPVATASPTTRLHAY